MWMDGVITSGYLTFVGTKKDDITVNEIVMTIMDNDNTSEAPYFYDITGQLKSKELEQRDVAKKVKKEGAWCCKDN